MRSRAAIYALIPALLVAAFVVVIVSDAAVDLKVVAGVVFVGASLVLLYKAGSLMRS
jgi:hypothetical protein